MAMKTLKDFYEDSWPTTKYHRSEAHGFAVDVWGWVKGWKARKLKSVMDRSKLYWRKKRQRQRVVRMLQLQKKFEAALKSVKENAHV